MKMKIKTILLFLLISITSQSFSQCFAPSTLFTSNTNYYNSEVNWNTSLGAHFYRIRYKIIGTSNWSYKNNIDSSLNLNLLTNLTPLSDYIWQIKSYCDTTNTSISSWSVTDTFTTITNTCPNTNILFTTSINFNNATANWGAISGANRYKIRYKILGTTTWSNLGPIYHPVDSATIPMLQQNTTYEWQVLTFHDASSLLGSLWSASDTFSTTSFVPAPFNPIVTTTISNLECNTPAEFTLQITQSTNEPDIGTSTITSDGGYFDISSLSMGDSVGYVIITSAFQNINAVLKAGIIAGPNYAIINSYDSTGSLVGFFTIENINGGTKISTTTPNDGNNYTSGYISDVHFTSIYVNPPNAGSLNFFVNVESELNDQISITSTVQIWCNSTDIIELKNLKEIVEIYDVFGRKTRRTNHPLFYIYNDGTVEKRIVIE